MTPKQAKAYAKARWAEGIDQASIAKELNDKGFRTRKGSEVKAYNVSYWLTATSKTKRRPQPKQAEPSTTNEMMELIKKTLETTAIDAEDRNAMALMMIEGMS